MKMKFLLILFFISSLTLTAQVAKKWAARYNDESGNGDDAATALAIDNNGNVYVTGRCYNALTYGSFATVKYDSNGTLRWAQQYSGPNLGEDYANSIKVDIDGNVYVTGVSNDNGNDDYTTIKYSPSGTQLWLQKYDGPDSGPDAATAMTIDKDGNIYVTGRSYKIYNIIYEDYEFATVKYNSAGSQLWVRRYDGPGDGFSRNDGATAIVTDDSGNVYVTGYSPASGAGNDYVTIKYKSDGSEQWVQRYNGTGSAEDFPRSIAVDDDANVYVTGRSMGMATDYDYTTIKYNSLGDMQWIRSYNGLGNSYDDAFFVTADNGNIHITGVSVIDGFLGSSDIVTIEYNSAGTEQWVARYDGPGVYDYLEGNNPLAVDGDGNVYVTGGSKAVDAPTRDIVTIKYNSVGNQQWVKRYNGPGNGHDHGVSIAADTIGNVYVVGQSTGNATGLDYVTIKYSQTSDIVITSPLAGETWITGEKAIINWEGEKPGQLLALDYSTDNGNTFLDIAFAVSADSEHYTWNVPSSLLTTRAKIKITDIADTAVYAISDTFKIKGYILTRYDSFGNFDTYTQFRDPYSFSNDPIPLWSEPWYQRFNYSGTDPFTSFGYLAGGTISSRQFLNSASSDFPDWVSWVRTFGTAACYHRMSFPPSYSPTAVMKWIVSNNDWGGSCFGMSASNSLYFKNKTDFLGRYPSMPNANPLFIVCGDTVRTVINELFTHQFGKEHRTYRQTVGLNKTPNQTLNDIKKMLIDDNEPIRTLSMVSNDPAEEGGHSILAYKLEQDPTLKNLYYVFVYDNAYPQSVGSATITIDTSANNGNGTWTPNYAWQNWGGTKWFYLRDPATNYLLTPSLPNAQTLSSPFILEENDLQIFNTRNASVLITDQQGNRSGFSNGVLLDEIPNSVPNIVENGSSGPPIGYDLPSSNYSILMSGNNDSTEILGVFTGNKSFIFQRGNTETLETDRFYFDGGLSYSNPDANSKPINIITVVNQTTEEKAYSLNEIAMAQNDSIKLEYPDEDKLKLVSYGSAKNYKLIVEVTKSNGIESFSGENIPISANSSHTLEPNWSNLNAGSMLILVDEGDNGTIEDSMIVNNVLPVELSSFSVLLSGASVELIWRTETEVSNYGFEVERSSVGSTQDEWKKIAFIQGHGNSNSPKNYSFVDKKALNGKYYYRLKQIDTDGSFKYSKIVEIEITAPKKYELNQNYPNPFNPNTNIEFAIPQTGLVNLSVYNLLGEKVTELVNEVKEPGIYTMNFDATNLSSGIYFYKLQAGNFIETKKMILLR